MINDALNKISYLENKSSKEEKAKLEIREKVNEKDKFIPYLINLVNEFRANSKRTIIFYKKSTKTSIIIMRFIRNLLRTPKNYFR